MIDGTPTITELAEAMKKLPPSRWWQYGAPENVRPIQVLVDEPRPVSYDFALNSPVPCFHYLSFVPTRIRHAEKGECIVWEYHGAVMSDLPA